MMLLLVMFCVLYVKIMVERVVAAGVKRHVVVSCSLTLWLFFVDLCHDISLMEQYP